MLLFLNASAAQLDRGDLTSAQRSLDEVARAQDAIGISAFTVVSTLASINQGWVQLVKGDSEGARVRFEAAGRLARRTGVGAGSARLGLACAATRSDPEASARLHGQAQALVSAVGQTWRAQEARFRQESIDYLLAVLGYDAFDLLFAEGLVALVDNGSSVALEIVVQANPRLRRKTS
jgi:hypothetical protein